MADTATLKPVKPHPSAAVAPALSPHACSFSMLSDVGRVRHINQDACAALPEHGAFVVCDGVGGAAAGEVASHLAIDAFLNSLAHPAAQSRADKAAEPETHPPNHPRTRLQYAVRAANHAVFQRAQRSRALRGMGTTLVAILLDDTPDHPGTLWVAHVGDSRSYLYRRGELRQLTQDHSLVEEQIRAGLLGRDEAESSPIRNIITRAIGTQAAVEPDIASHPAQPGDLVLLASDGLNRELDDAAIASILAQTSGSSLEPTCQALVDAANAKGGRDNITVLLIACD